MVNSNSSSPASEQSALGLGVSPSTEHPRYDQATAPAYKLSTVADPEEAPGADEAIQMLMDLLSKGSRHAGAKPNTRPSWSRRKALVCTALQYRENIARCLTENGYEVFLPEDTRQAVETMRAKQMDLVLLEPQFDPAEQGAAFVVREINILRPAQRRRLFFVLVSPSLRTMDAHAAFLNNVNAVVHLSEIDNLPRLLEVAFREYNELYREFNQALNLSAL
ncbi:MAG TPA: hypothetical protein VGQ39_15825 [Pyrinomonadaceae bacterium]|jgi:hypothetical protein|nr:hypothetical protein [Pyrinomonadaceae bacterium]